MKKVLFAGIISAIYVLSGCTALQPLPNVGRGGDTITLAVGSPLDMTRANTTATFTSDADGIPIDITSNIRSIFKLYADPTGKLFDAASNTVELLVESSGHSPWITIVALNLPVGIPVGTGQIQFNTTAKYPAIGSHINNLPLTIEIIAGTGSANSFDYEFGQASQLPGDLTSLESQPKLVFGPAQPSAACPCPKYAAIEVKSTLAVKATDPDGPYAGANFLLPGFYRVIAEDLTVFTGSGRSVLHGLSNDGVNLTVMFLSQGDSMLYNEAQFSVVLPSFMSFDGLPAINSVRYFDKNGNELSGPVADYSAALK